MNKKELVVGEGKGEVKYEVFRAVPNILATDLLDYNLPQKLQEKPFTKAPVILFREQKQDNAEYTAVFIMPLSSATFWDLLQTTTPYKHEWPSAVIDDWNMWGDRVKTHKKLGAAWDDFIPHIPIFRSIMPRLYRFELDKLKTDPKYTKVKSDNYILPITRWISNGVGLERSLITEHSAKQRSPEVEEFLQKLTEQYELEYHPDRVDELVGFVLNTFLAYPERRDWKPFMDLDGNEYDKMQYGKNNFIGPAQLTTRTLMAREKILSNSFFKNAENRFV